MAPLPVESTSRYVVHYSSGGHAHTQTFRTDPPASPSAMETFLDALWSAVAPILFQCTITDVVFYPDTVVIGNSVAMPSFIGQVYGSGTPIPVEQPLYVNFIARSTGGRRYRLAFFSPTGTDPSFRFYTAEDANVAAAVALLEGMTDLVGIDSLPLVWKQYANNGYNAYWQRAVRS